MEAVEPGYNDFARLLAGMGSLHAEDSFATDRLCEAWKEHGRVLDGLFGRFEASYARPFAEWAQLHLGEFRRHTTVLYPFSGPDFMFAHLLHPTAETYVLAGLEACESPAEARRASIWEPRMKLLPELSDGIQHFLQHSFFVTSEMKGVFGSPRWNGILAPLLVMLARTDHRITAVESVEPSITGDARMSDNAPARAVRIRAVHRGKEKQIYYFQRHLRDDHCPSTDPFFQFAGALGPLAVFLKSASYLLHEPDFSHLRSFILNHAACLVQDPSSMPYEGLLQRAWQVKVHGRYVRAPRVFPQYEQHELIQACKSSTADVPSLPFGIGYHSQPDTASLMVAIPRATPASMALRSRSLASRSGRRNLSAAERSRKLPPVVRASSAPNLSPA